MDRKNFEQKNYDSLGDNPELPFLGNLKGADFAPEKGFKIKTLENNHDIVIRVSTYIGESEKEKKHRIEHYKKGEKYFAELQEKYNIRIPKTQFVIGKDEHGYPALYTIIERVHGKNLDERTSGENDDVYIEELEELYINLLRYFEDKHSTNEDILNDFDNVQFVYGKRKNETENHIYLVDVDPTYGSHSSEYAYFLFQMAKMITEAEKSLGEKLLDARAKFKEVFELLSAEEKKNINNGRINALLSD